MQQEIINTAKNTNNTHLDNGPANQIDDYSEILNAYEIKYKEVDYYLQVKEVTQVQGWILHLSVITMQIMDLLKVILPVLIEENITFKLIKNKEIHRNLVEGLLGYTQLGKIFSLYPENDEKALSLAKKLIVLTRNFRGPVIPTDIFLGGIVYTRYGGFNPIIRTDEYGKINKYIYSKSGQLIQDNYTIPFVLPAEIHWPFSEICSSAMPKSGNLRNHSYKRVSIIKSDVKGQVIKGIYIKRFLHVDWCLVKQGKMNMCADNAGRDIKDRLKWQFELYKDLSSKIPLPAIFDFFEENGDTYLVMKFIEGVTLNQIISSNYKGNRWVDMTLSGQMFLLKYLLEILKIIERLHQKGYVHRDITPFNFLLDKKNRIFLIDMELAYCKFKEKPNPPFALGTTGFMSPEQFALKTPTEKEDIYGFGALMIVFFTNLYPAKFGAVSVKTLEEQLCFFIPNKPVATIIATCLDSDPYNRPTLTEIEYVIQQYQKQLQLKSTKNSKPDVPPKTEIKNVELVINAALRGLTSPFMMSPKLLWASKTIQTDNFVGNEQLERSYYCGLHEGIGGVLYLLARAKKMDLDISICMPGYIKNREFIQAYYVNRLPNIPSGLYTGGAGIALALILGMESKLIEDTEEATLQIQDCLKLAPCGLDMATGVAGQGIAVLQCLFILQSGFADSLLKQYIATILKNQQEDGSWVLSSHGEGEKKDMKITGFAYGIAGIIYFLLEYVNHYGDVYVRETAHKALNWLIKQAQKKEDVFFWPVHSKTKRLSPWVNDGFTGIALTFIKAYEVLGDPIYKKVAEGALSNHPHYIVSNYLSQSWGLAGLGEVYLDAARIFKSEQWQDRADWIAQLFIHTCQYQPDGSCYWLVDDNSFPTADLMVGNSGIIHFLMRYLRPNKLSFPLLPD